MLFFHNGNILTQNKKRPTCEAVLVEGNTIVAVGTHHSLLKKTNEATQFIDLQGKTLMPAFIDAHIHIWKVGNLLTLTLDLRGSKSIVEILEKIKIFNLQNPDNQYINARGFNESQLAEQRMLSKKDLDLLGISKPIVVQRTCAHITVVNSFALEKIKDTTISLDVNGGKVEEENGVLYETAQGLVQKIVAPYGENDYKKMIFAATKALAEVGVCTACDPAVMPDLLAVYHTLNTDNQLDMRINAVPIRIPDGAVTSLPIPDFFMSQKLGVNTVKFFADGGLSGKTAALRKTYKNSNEKGILRLEKDTFFELAAEANKKGFTVATHAIGDEAIDLVLDVYEKLYEAYKIQNRIEHLGLPDEKQLQRIKKANAYVVSQPVFLDELGKNFIQYLDENYLNICYPYRSMLEKGIELVFSTDAPVVKNLNPFQSIQSAVTRQTADKQTIANKEKITIKQGLYAYTYMGAKVLGLEKELGSIEKGKWADLIVLNKNPLTTNAEDLTTIKVEQVFFDGKQKI
jgi:predicted amidohydrolase YtcJ